jgi:NADH-quinone oxidoreductase subunit J
MPIFEIVFYLFSAVLLAAAAAVITVRNPVFAALCLVLAFFSSAAIWMLLEVEFLAIILVLVYVGAVLVLFLFVVMMLDINIEPLREGFIRYLPAGIVVALLMAAELLLVLWARGRFDPAVFPLPEGSPEGYSNTRAVGEWLFTNYLLAFEVAGVVLLVAIIAAVALTLRSRTGAKRQNPSAQVRVQRDERVRLVKMNPEPRPGPAGDGPAAR